MSNGFIITIDTEGDNLWNWDKKSSITTENAKFIPRFQELCEEYGFKPVYLINYEMAQNSNWVKYAKAKAQQGLCDIGMHIHAWNTPPEFELENLFGGNSYIFEYPDEIVEQKIAFLTNFLENRFETKILSARSGRWATNSAYFDSLKRNGYMVDCSMTPDLDLSSIPGMTTSSGNNYCGIKRNAFVLPSGIIEVPMTTKKIRHWANGSIRHKVACLLRGDRMWLRPYKKSLEELLLVSKKVSDERNGYLEFMIHSSELMPGGSPYFKTEEDVELLYSIMDKYFQQIVSEGYIGMTLACYAHIWKTGIMIK